jgi:hypothetical protein
LPAKCLVRRVDGGHAESASLDVHPTEPELGDDMDRRNGMLRGFTRVVVALALCLAAGLAVATPAGAVVATTEFPYNSENRACSSVTSTSGVYKFDFCLSVGFVHTNPRRHVGQVTMACRTVSGNRLVTCRSMTNNAATLWGNIARDFDSVRQWSDSVPNVSRYISHSSPSFNCRDSEYTSTDVTALLSVRFPDNTVRTGILFSMTRSESEGCFF